MLNYYSRNQIFHPAVPIPCPLRPRVRYNGIVHVPLVTFLTKLRMRTTLNARSAAAVSRQNRLSVSHFSSSPDQDLAAQSLTTLHRRWVSPFKFTLCCLHRRWISPLRFTLRLLFSSSLDLTAQAHSLLSSSSLNFSAQAHSCSLSALFIVAGSLRSGSLSALIIVAGIARISPLHSAVLLFRWDSLACLAVVS